jgi:hypothetical protein
MPGIPKGGLLPLAPADLALDADLFAEAIEFLRKLFINPDLIWLLSISVMLSASAAAFSRVEGRRRFT